MTAKVLNLVFLGPPGAGKGTQASRLSGREGIPHVSTGDLFRANLKEETPVGLMARGFMDRGLLVPDDVVCQMVRERLEEEDSEQGFILDGFPRTEAQAVELEAHLKRLGRPLTAVVSFVIPDDLLVARLTGRLTCRECGSIFHQVNKPPKSEGVCDACGARALYTREDDREDAVRARLTEYRDKTAPLLAFYDQRAVLVSLEAEHSMDAVGHALVSVLEDR